MVSYGPIRFFFEEFECIVLRGHVQIELNIFGPRKGGKKGSQSAEKVNDSTEISLNKRGEEAGGVPGVCFRWSFSPGLALIPLLSAMIFPNPSNEFTIV